MRWPIPSLLAVVVGAAVATYAENGGWSWLLTSIVFGLWWVSEVAQSIVGELEAGKDRRGAAIEGKREEHRRARVEAYERLKGELR